MTDKERDDLITSLADTLMHTRAELDAMRTVVIGLLRGLADQPIDHAAIAGRIAGAIEGDEAASLNSLMNDQMLALREHWMTLLLPPIYRPR